MPPSRIPQGWLEYSNIGRPILNTRFICFKTPVNPAQPYKHYGKVPKIIAPVTQFTTDDLIRNISVRGWNLGLVIDLTNTTKYYNKNLIEDAGIEYMKIFCEGHVVPSAAVFSTFANTVKRYLVNNKTNSNLVGVHCTHGVNRTGYIVCRYLIEMLGYTAVKALHESSEARGFPLERQNYINDLHQRIPSIDPTIIDVLKKTPVPPETEPPPNTEALFNDTDDLSTEGMHRNRTKKSQLNKRRGHRAQDNQTDRRYMSTSVIHRSNDVVYRRSSNNPSPGGFSERSGSTTAHYSQNPRYTDTRHSSTIDFHDRRSPSSYGSGQNRRRRSDRTVDDARGFERGNRLEGAASQEAPPAAGYTSRPRHDLNWRLKPACSDETERNTEYPHRRICKATARRYHGADDVR